MFRAASKKPPARGIPAQEAFSVSAPARLLSRHFRDVADNVDALVHAERTAVEADVVIPGLAPIAVRIVLILDLALAVLFL